MDSRQTLPLVFLCIAIYAWVALGLFVVKSALLTMVLYWALCGAGWLVLRPKLRLQFKLKQIAAAFLALIGSFVTTWLLMEFALPLLPPSVIPVVTTHPLQEVGMNAQTYLLIAILFGILNPIAEEAFWRGRVMSMLPGAPSIAIALQALIFAGFHVMPLTLMFTHMWLPLAIVFIGGVIFGVVALRTRGLPIPWALHAGVNAYLLIWFGRFIAMGS